MNELAMMSWTTVYQGKAGADTSPGRKSNSPAFPMVSMDAGRLKKYNAVISLVKPPRYFAVAAWREVAACF
jgi:hypothetical protein